MKQTIRFCILAVILMLFFNGCSGSNVDKAIMNDEQIAGCSSRPNCVSSKAEDTKHFIEPFRLKGDTTAGWEAIRGIVGQLPRTRIIRVTDRYLHAECKSRVFGFIDDLELQLDPVTSIVAVRSAARIGYSDLGVNRRRIEALRRTLREDDLIHR